jgi:hypothetical protein
MPQALRGALRHPWYTRCAQHITERLKNQSPELLPP